MSEEDLKDVAGDAAEQDISEYENLENFVDLEDLSSLMDDDDFTDLEDLGDISDLDLDGDGILEDEAAQAQAEASLTEDDASDSAQAEASLTEDDASDSAQAVSLDEPEQEMDYSDMASLDDLPDPSEIEDLGLFSDSGEQPDIPTPEIPEATSVGQLDIPTPEIPVATSGEASLDDMVGDFLDDLDASGGAVGQEVQPEETVFDSLGAEENELPDVTDTSDIQKDSETETDRAVAPAGKAEPDEVPEPVLEEEPEEEAFGLDDILALEPEEENGHTDDMQALLEGLSEDDMPELPPEGSQEDIEKKPGLLKRLFGNIVTDEIAEAELAQKEKDKEDEAARQEAAEAAKEEKKAAKAAKAEEKAEAKKAKAEEKELKKAAKAEEKAQKKAEKEARKAEEAAQEELEVTGKLNKVGVSIVVILAAMFLATEISGTEIFSYKSTMKQAVSFFDDGRYTDAYREILGTDLKKKDQETYDKIITVMKVQRSLNSYENYDNMKYYPDALNALLVGLKKYDENIETARNLEVEKDVDSCKEKILTLLDEEYGLSEVQARELLSLKKDVYTDQVVKLGIQKKNS